MRVRILGCCMVAAAGVLVATVAGPAPAGAASGVTRCGTYVPKVPGGGSWTTHPPAGFTPVANLTTRRTRCAYARRVSLAVSHRSSAARGFGFRCHTRTVEEESFDIRCTRGRQVIRWQGGD